MGRICFNGSAITYDAIGNPLQYRNGMTFTWSNGRKLASATQNGATTTFTYDGEGNRIRKVSGNTTIRYFYDKTPMLSMENVGVFLLEREKNSLFYA